jgi:hypothetical protein
MLGLLLFHPAEAPLVLPSPIEMFTLGLDGSVASARRSDGTSWSPLTLLPTKDSYSKLRRLRVIITLSFGGGKDTQLFYISQDNQLQGRRKEASSDWTDPVPSSGDVKAHAFSNIMCSSSDGKDVHVFFINSRGLLHVTSWFPPLTQWPGRMNLALQEASLLLLAGGCRVSYRLSSGDSTQELVIAVVRNLHLYLAVYTIQKG